MATPKRRDGHPRPEIGRRISLLAAIGVSFDETARVCGIGNSTLTTHYRDDWELGKVKADEVVGGKIFEAAKRGEHWACALWAARRMGWKETSVQQQTGPDGGPVEHKIAADDTIVRLLEEVARLKAGVAQQG